jgi:tetratricopeptide (TPR) repeat protein
VETPPQLEVLSEPAGIPSVISPISSDEAPEAFVVEEGQPETSPEAEAKPDDESGVEPQLEDTEELEEIEEIEEFEELDDFELIEEDEDEEPAPQRAATAPPAPPTQPRTPPPPARASTAPPPRPQEQPLSAKEEDISEEVEDSLTKPDEVSVLEKLVDGREVLDWSKRAEQLRRELDQAEAPARVGELAYELGELYIRRLDDEASAIKEYGRALQADPSLRANLWAIRKVFYRRGLWPNLVKLIGAELRFASNDREKTDLLVERGNVLLNHEEDVVGARESFEQAIEIEPNNVQALLALERIARSLNYHNLLWQTLEGLAEASNQPDRKVAFLVELAREYRLSGSHFEEARETLARATEQKALPNAVAVEREALARAMDDSAALAASLERRVATQVESFGPAGVPSPEEAAEHPDIAQRLRLIVAMRRHQAQLHLRDEDTEGAWSCMQEALTVSPHDALVLVDLAEMAERLGRYDELAEIVAMREFGEVDPNRALGLALRRASALARAGKKDQAEELLSARAQGNPGYLPLVAGRELNAGERQDWYKLAALQGELGDAIRLGTSFGPGADIEPEPANAAIHYIVAGDLLRFGAGAGAQAAERYIQALELVPDDETATDALVSLYVAQGQFALAAPVLERQAEQTQGASAQRSLFSLATVYMFLGRREEELAVLRRLEEQATDAEKPELRSRVVELLRELQRYDELASMLRESAASTADAELRGRYWRLRLIAFWMCCNVPRIGAPWQTSMRIA